MMRWLFEPSNAALVGGLSFLISLSGVVVTLVAFGLTIWQVVQAKGMANAARLAALEAKSQSRKYDLVAALSQSGLSLSGSLSHMRNASWEDAIEGLLKAEIAIVQIVELAPELGSRHSDMLRESLSRIEPTRRRLRAIRARGAARGGSDAAFQEVENISVLVAQVRAQIEGGI